MFHRIRAQGPWLLVSAIVLGLLIAVSLEQTVEYFHHRREVKEIREALRLERARRE